MATTTKRDIAERVAQQLGLSQVTVKQVLQMLLDEIVNELAAGNRIEFRDFGVFKVVMRKARTGRNPRTGEAVAVPPKKVVAFKMGKLMKQKIAPEETSETAAASEPPEAPDTGPSAPEGPAAPLL